MARAVRTPWGAPPHAGLPAPPRQTVCPAWAMSLPRRPRPAAPGHALPRSTVSTWFLVFLGGLSSPELVAMTPLLETIFTGYGTEMCRRWSPGAKTAARTPLCPYQRRPACLCLCVCRRHLTAAPEVTSGTRNCARSFASLGGVPSWGQGGAYVPAAARGRLRGPAAPTPPSHSLAGPATEACAECPPTRGPHLWALLSASRMLSLEGAAAHTGRALVTRTPCGASPSAPSKVVAPWLRVSLRTVPGAERDLRLRPFRRVSKDGRGFGTRRKPRDRAGPRAGAVRSPEVPARRGAAPSRRTQILGGETAAGPAGQCRPGP